MTSPDARGILLGAATSTSTPRPISCMGKHGRRCPDIRRHQ
jgi:hypothetical protein